MTPSHEHFEVLCALAGSEELLEPETVVLRQHAQGCPACRTRILETTQLTSHLLLAHAFRQRKGRLSKGMRERFVTKAMAEGIPLTREAAAGFGKLGLASVLLAILLIAAAVVRHAMPVPSTEVSAHLHIAPMAAVHPDHGRERPKEISLSRRHSARAARFVPLEVWSLRKRDFPVPLSLSPEAPVRLRFPAPLVLRNNNALNLMANFQPEASSPASRTFEYSGDSIPRFVQLCRCESR